jgi:hypothetical protein
MRPALNLQARKYTINRANCAVFTANFSPLTEQLCTQRTIQTGQHLDVQLFS